MTSPQTASRQNKIKMLKASNNLILELLTANMKKLDGIDSRNIKKIVAQLQAWVNG